MELIIGVGTKLELIIGVGTKRELMGTWILSVLGTRLRESLMLLTA